MYLYIVHSILYTRYQHIGYRELLLRIKMEVENNMPSVTLISNLYKHSPYLPVTSSYSMSHTKTTCYRILAFRHGNVLLSS